MIGSDIAAVGFFGSNPDGSNAWTLTTLVGKFLNEAERRYGPRDQSYTPLGIEFGRGGPCTWYPGDCRHACIRLGEEARNDPAQAVFQLAHEVVHLLAPTGKADAPVFEEGIATVFSEEMAEAEGSAVRNRHSDYEKAARLVRQFIAKYPNGIARSESRSLRL